MEDFNTFEFRSALNVRHPIEKHGKDPFSKGNTGKLVVSLFIFMNTGKLY